VKPAHVITIVLAVIAVILAAILSGWDNDKAKPGSKGRGTVTAPRPAA
jgi:hypothetical protein